MKKVLKFALVILMAISINTYGQITTENNNVDLGRYASSIGKDNTSTGIASQAYGFDNIAKGNYSTAIGSYLSASANGSIVIGNGLASFYKLVNNTSSSLMVGFDSDVPTFMVTGSGGIGKTGKVGIGYMDFPLFKLHLRADIGEEAAIFVEPNNWDAGEESKIMLGDTNHVISTNKNLGMEFNSFSNFVFNGNNSGFGIEEPKAKVHINGDLLFEHSLNGIIMKSEDGNCWKGTISNNGELTFSQIDCETLTSTENITEPKHSEVFIYPNPTNGQITVEYTGNKKNLRLEIKSISGHLVATYKINKGENRIELNNISDQMIVASVFTKKGDLISTNKVVIKK